jgi:predicted DsbA family dithiol-disulfide isomerase/uncharacterized membrane protein
VSSRDARSGALDGPSPPAAGGVGVEILAPLLALLGLCISAYLTALQQRVLIGDLSFGAACGAVGGDCDAVVASRWGTLLGLPVSAWGTAYYAVAGTLSLAIVLLRREDTPAFARSLLWLAAAALLFDAYLGFAMWRRLERLCVACVATYAINLALFAIAWRCCSRLRPERTALGALLPSLHVLLRPADPLYYREVLKAFLAGLAALGIAAPLAQGLLAARGADERERAGLESLIGYLREVEPVAIASEGRPARGPEDAPLTLVLFLDLLCEQCRLASRYLDIVAAGRAETLRIVALGFPIDARCNEHARDAGADLHPGACWLAQGAECAHRLGRYWAFHDAVFSGNEPVRSEAVVEYAIRAGLEPAAFQACLSDPAVAGAVRADIATARSLGVRATPTLFLNGRPVVGALKPRLLEAALATVEELPVTEAQRPSAAPGTRSR